MKVILIKKDKEKLSSYGGKYIRVYFKDMNNKSYFLDVYFNHILSKRWIPFLKEQALFDNVNTFKSSIIDGTSNFIYLGQKQKP